MPDNKKLKEILTNIIHEPTQFHQELNLAYVTVSRIGKLQKRGSLDFGGSEYSKASVEWLSPEKKASDDKYGWWSLEGGSYRVEFNEGVNLPDDTGVLLQIWADAAKNGVTHPTEVITDSREPLSAQIHVSPPGIEIKENARLSEIRVL